MNQMDVIRPPQLADVSFSGERTAFRELVMRGGFLELLTVGFYRFWLTTDMRRHLWSNTEVGGDAAEYTGRAKELLVGFLIALAVLVPIYLTYFVASFVITQVQAFASIPLFIFFYALGQFAIYRARRYRLTRTVWRGVRFWMSGSGWAYAIRAMLWGLLTVLTLGLAFPWRAAALERYKMQHSFYGDLQGSFEGNGWDLFKSIWWLWPLAIAAAIIFPLWPFVYAIFKAAEWRWWISGIRFGDVNFESDLSRAELIGTYWKAIGWWVVLFAAFAAYILLFTQLMTLENGTQPTNFLSDPDFSKVIPFVVLQGAGYLVLIISMTIVTRVYLVRDVWMQVVESTQVSGIEAAYEVVAQGELADAVGEGLADGLDVTGF